jgi:hypothetical protein
MESWGVCVCVGREGGGGERAVPAPQTHGGPARRSLALPLRPPAPPGPSHTRTLLSPRASPAATTAAQKSSPRSCATAAISFFSARRPGRGAGGRRCVCRVWDAAGPARRGSRAPAGKQGRGNRFYGVFFFTCEPSSLPVVFDLSPPAPPPLRQPGQRALPSRSPIPSSARCVARRPSSRRQPPPLGGGLPPPSPIRYALAARPPPHGAHYTTRLVS